MRLPAICSKPPRTPAGCDRQYRAVFNAYTRAFAGGGAFGYDWPTLRINWPEGYAKLQELEAWYRAWKLRASLRRIRSVCDQRDASIMRTAAALHPNDDIGWSEIIPNIGAKEARRIVLSRVGLTLPREI
jgi:hypothetical protein